MGALPKKKVSRRRRDNRRSHIHIQTLPLSRCPNGHLRPTHRACPECGEYNGLQVLRVKAKRKEA